MTATLTFRESNTSNRSVRIQMLASNLRNDRLMTSLLPLESAIGKTLKKSTDLMWLTRSRQMRATT